MNYDIYIGNDYNVLLSSLPLALWRRSKFSGVNVNVASAVSCHTARTRLYNTQCLRVHELFVHSGFCSHSLSVFGDKRISPEDPV